MRSTSYWPYLRASLHVACFAGTWVVGQRVYVIADQVIYLKRLTGTWW